MDRRSFLSTASLAGTAAATGALASPALAQGTRRLTMVTTWERGQTGVFDAAQRVADTMSALSDGGLTIEVAAAGERVRAYEVFDTVVAGQADMYHGADHYFVDQHPAYAFFASVPFGMTAQELASWYHHGAGHAFHDELGQIFGLKSFLAGNSGTQAGGWFKKPISKPDDFEGLRCRMAGLGGAVLSKLRATAQTLPASEIPDALSSNEIDAAEWIGPWADEALGLQNAASFYYVAGFHEPGAAMSLAINRDIFNSLTPSQQKIAEIASAEAYQWSLSQFNANNSAALTRLRSSGTEIMEFPESVWDAFGRATEEVLRANMEDALYARVHEDYTTAMRASSSWNEMSETAFKAQRRRVMG